MLPVISAQNTPFIAAAVIGLEPMFPVILVVWLPVSVIPVCDRITKLPAVKRPTGAGPAASAWTAKKLPVAIIAAKIKEKKSVFLINFKIIFISLKPLGA